MRYFLGWFFCFAQLWRSSKFEMLLYTVEKREVGNLLEAVDVMALSEDLEIGDCEENGGY